MSRIGEAFKDKKAFIAFVTGGDPNLTITEQLIYAMEKAGADLIESNTLITSRITPTPIINAPIVEI